MATAAAIDEHVCVSCGICCGGSLFDYATLTPEEAPRMRDLGFPVGMLDGKPVFPLPCVHLGGTVCQVYHSRPATCGKYSCTTMRAIDSGEIDRPEAERRIAVTKAAVADVRKRLLPGETLLQLRVRFGEDPSPPPDFQLTMVLYDRLMDRYFRRAHQRVLS